MARFVFTPAGEPTPPPASGDLATVNEGTSVNVGGTTLNFSTTVQHGVYDGPYTNVIWVRPASGSTVTINSYTPGYGTVSSGRTGNGAQMNLQAIQPDLGDPQGWDQYGNSGPTFSNAVRAAVPIVMSADDCLVIAQSNASFPGDFCINRFVYVHCVEDVPFADEFAPPTVWPSSAGARPRMRYSSVNEALYPSFSSAGYANSRPALSTVMPEFLRNRVLDHVVIWRRYNMEQYVSGNPVKLYGRSLQLQADPFYAFICSDAPIADKRVAAKWLIQRGIDTYGVMVSGQANGRGFHNADGGQHMGRINTVIVAGHLLGNATMRDYVKTTWTPLTRASPSEYQQYCFLTPEAVAATQQPGWDGAGSGANYPYETAHGQAPAMPEWQATGLNPGPGVNAAMLQNYWTWDLPFYYRLPSGAFESGGQQVALLSMGLRSAFEHDAYFDYYARSHGIIYYGDDPWRYVNGNGSPRYNLITTAPSAISLDSYIVELYDKVIFKSPTYYELPAGVNDFNGAT